MRMVRLTLNDGEVKEQTEEEAMLVNLMQTCNGKTIIKAEFFEEDGK
jgi:hypothetical protein